MVRKRLNLVVLVTASLLGTLMVLQLGILAPQAKKPVYQLDVAWPKNSELFSGKTYAVAVDSLLNLVYVAQRGKDVPKVLVFTEDGFFLGAWNTDTIEMPHGIFFVNNITHHSVWITDVGDGIHGHSIKQYDPFGKLIRALGTPGKAGSALNPLQFDQPAEICVDKNGDIYIVDGDGGQNNRLLKLAADFSIQWLRGENGSDPGQFYIPHSVTVDSVGRIHVMNFAATLYYFPDGSQDIFVWVADRGNKRIQVFDKVSGEFLGSWNSCFSEDGPYSVRLTTDEKYLIVAQLNMNRVNVIAVPPIGNIGECLVVSRIQLADKVSPHLVDVNVRTGSIYIAEIGADQVQKYVPHK